MGLAAGLVFAIATLLLACSSREHASPNVGDPDASVDASEFDAAMLDAGEPDAAVPDAAVSDAAVIDARGCRLDGRDQCGNGEDDDCDGSVDEGCPCARGAVQPCFTGTPRQRHVGACSDGLQRCIGEPGQWGVCGGGAGPTEERCNGLDDDCDGAGDAPACPATLACPAPGSLPDAQLLHHYRIDGTRFFSGAAISWSWTVTGGPCDQLFASQGKPTGFVLAGSDTAQLTFTPTQVGDYTVHLTITTAEGTLSCTFIIHVAGAGVAFELCWDTSGLDDLDLHVHAPHSTRNWFDENDDCFYLNCSTPSLIRVNWGYPQSPLPKCVGDLPTDAVDCPNPRLYIDNVYDPGRAEITAIDTPESGATYRMMANFFGGRDPTLPIANVYCDGRLVASFGQAPDTVPGFRRGGGDGLGSMWRIADVTTRVSGTVTTCDVAALHPPRTATGYDVRIGDTTF